MLTFLDRISGHVAGVKVSGKVTHEDYQRLAGKLEEIIREHGKVSVFCELQECQGSELGAACEDLRFGLKHHGDFDRCAVVGETRWHKWISKLSAPFFNVKYFDSPHFQEAWDWVTHSDEAA